MNDECEIIYGDDDKKESGGVFDSILKAIVTESVVHSESAEAVKVAEETEFKCQQVEKEEEQVADDSPLVDYYKKLDELHDQAIKSLEDKINWDNKWK